METILNILAVIPFIILLILLLGLMVEYLIYALSDRIYEHLIMRIVWTSRALDGTDEKDASLSATGPSARPTSTTELLPTEDLLVAHKS